MLTWALIFLVIALIASALGLGGIAGPAMGASRFFLTLFLIVVLLAAIAGVVLVGL